MVQKRIGSLRTSLALVGVLSASFLAGCKPASDGPGGSDGVVVNLPSDDAIEAALPASPKRRSENTPRFWPPTSSGAVRPPPEVRS